MFKMRKMLFNFALCSSLLLGLSVEAVAQVGCEYPRSLIILDRSASMQSQIGGETKWEIASNAIESMLNQYGQSTYFGLMLYPGPSGLGAQGVEGAVGACRRNQQNDSCSPSMPMCSTGEVVVGVGPNTAQLIQNELVWPNSLTNAYTPTWQSLEKATTYAPLVQGNHDKYAILITDGWQCCGYFQDANGRGQCESAGSERRIAVDKVQALRNQGVTVFVVGFGGGVDVSTLQDMSVEAGTQRAGCDPSVTEVSSDRLCYYQASDSASLNTLLTDIARQISEEVCDGQDNDCDGQIDETLTQTCRNACGNGISVCSNGQWGECNLPTPIEESCNAQDDDCDGQIDEDLSRSCSTACGVGMEMCNFGNWGGCTAPPVQAEQCNALDDNCDGRIDENCDCLDGSRQDCGSNVGICTTGVQICSQNTWGECQGQILPKDEDCNGLDDDCDGNIDEVVAQDCSNACGSGSISCINGQWSTCDAPPVGTESCNGLDDDCDAIQDEGDFCQAEGGICLCGGCSVPCNNGECFNGAACQEGYCVIDQCPEGSYCLESLCLEGESPFQQDPMTDPNAGNNGGAMMPAEQGSATGSSCNTQGKPSSTIMLLAFLLAFFGLVRRRLIA